MPFINIIAINHFKNQAYIFVIAAEGVIIPRLNKCNLEMYHPTNSQKKVMDSQI
jgi:hypothetical protein